MTGGLAPCRYKSSRERLEIRQQQGRLEVRFEAALMLRGLLFDNGYRSPHSWGVSGMSFQLFQMRQNSGSSSPNASTAS